MRVEYQAVSDIAGPLLFVEGVSGVSYGELCSIKLPNGEERTGKVLEVHRDRAMVLGTKSNEYLAKAFEKDPDNPRINLMKGTSILFTPEAYGGGANNALEFLEKSISLFEKENIKNPLEPSWGKEEAYTFLGMAYEQKKEYNKAIIFLKKALEINPNYGMATLELDKIEKKIQEK